MSGQEEVKIGVTATLAAYLGEHPEAYEQVSEEIRHYVEEYQKALATVDGASAAHAFHKMIEDKFRTANKLEGSQVSCKEGCAFCCFTEVHITPDEADLLLRYAASEEIELDWEYIRTQSEAKQWHHLPYTQRKCVFLSSDNSCKAYKYRPASCRKYFVTGDPGRCNSKRYPGGDVKVLNVPSAEAIASAVFSVQGTDTLSRQLAKARSAK